MHDYCTHRIIPHVYVTPPADRSSFHVRGQMRVGSSGEVSNIHEFDGDALAVVWRAPPLDPSPLRLSDLVLLEESLLHRRCNLSVDQSMEGTPRIAWNRPVRSGNMV